MTQPSLFGTPPLPSRPTWRDVSAAVPAPVCAESSAPTLDESSLRAQWRTFRAENPHVYELFERFTLEAIRAGVKVGAKAVWERMRWETALVTRGDVFRLNNNWTAYVARDFMDEHPEHGGYFELRRAQSEERSA